MGQPAEAGFDVDAWARERAQTKLGRVLLRRPRRAPPVEEALPPPEAARPPVPPAVRPPVSEARAARRLQRCARRRTGRRRGVEAAMRAFAAEFPARPPLRWEKPRLEEALVTVQRDEASQVSRLSLASLETASVATQEESVASVVSSLPTTPRPERRRPARRKLPTMVNWGCPVDTSGAALLSRPPRKKNARLTMERPPRARVTHQSQGPARDAADAMERLALDTNALLTASLTEKLEDEHYRSTVAKEIESTAAGRRYHALERRRVRVAFQRVKFDCQVAMVMQLRDSGFLR